MHEDADGRLGAPLTAHQKGQGNGGVGCSFFLLLLLCVAVVLLHERRCVGCNRVEECVSFPLRQRGQDGGRLSLVLAVAQRGHGRLRLLLGISGVGVERGDEMMSMKMAAGPSLERLPSSTSTAKVSVSPSSFGDFRTTTTSVTLDASELNTETVAFGGSLPKLSSPSSHSSMR